MQVICNTSGLQLLQIGDSARLLEHDHRAIADHFSWNTSALHSQLRPSSATLLAYFTRACFLALTWLSFPELMG
jgi:hypothetical protein